MKTNYTVSKVEEKLRNAIIVGFTVNIRTVLLAADDAYATYLPGLFEQTAEGANLDQIWQENIVAMLKKS